MEEELGARAAALHRQAFVADMHADSVLAVQAGRRRLLQRSAEGHADLPRLLEAGVKLQVFALWPDPRRYQGGRALAQVMELLALLLREVEESGGRMVLVRAAGDLAEQPPEGSLQVLLSIEGGEGLGGSLGALENFYRLGVRALGLTWNCRNELADGCLEAGTGGGLTRFGRQVLGRMQELGMVIDLSHLSEAGFYDVLEHSRGPVVASHSNARAVCDHPRNLTDSQIRALAARGGVMGINFCPDFLCQGRPATVDDVVRHVDHVASLVGIEHVGLGSDYDGIKATPLGLEDVRRLPALTKALLARGYSEAAIRAVLGENVRRVLREVLA